MPQVTSPRNGLQGALSLLRAQRTLSQISCVPSFPVSHRLELIMTSWRLSAHVQFSDRFFLRARGFNWWTHSGTRYGDVSMSDSETWPTWRSSFSSDWKVRSVAVLVPEPASESSLRYRPPTAVSVDHSSLFYIRGLCMLIILIEHPNLARYSYSTTLHHGTIAQRRIQESHCCRPQERCSGYRRPEPLSWDHPPRPIRRRPVLQEGRELRG